MAGPVPINSLSENGKNGADQQLEPKIAILVMMMMMTMMMMVMVMMMLMMTMMMSDER